jgi:hypothetical protein
VRVELDIFSGRPNPVWELGEAEVRELESRIERATPSQEIIALPGLGYRGFVLHRPNPIRVYRGKIVHGRTEAQRVSAVAAIDLDYWLLESGKLHLDRVVYDACLDALRQP